MKLVVATPLYPPEIGGPATYVRLLEEGLPREGIEVTVVKFSDVRHLPKLIRHYLYYRRVLAAAREADAVLALDPASVGLPAMQAARRAGKPFVVKIVGDYAWEQGRQRFGVTQDLDSFVRSKQSSWFVRTLQAIEQSVAKGATAVIVPSRYLKGIVERWGVASDRICVIYTAIAVPKEEAMVRDSVGFLVVSSGRRVPWKGFEGIERVVAREPDWRFLLLQGLPRSEALAQVRGAAVFVLNSEYEGLSHALVEAMMLGVPVVATSTGGNPEVIEDGVTGLLVPPQDDEALYAALKRVADDPAAARARAAAALARVQGLFSVPTMLAQTAALLKSL